MPFPLFIPSRIFHSFTNPKMPSIFPFYFLFSISFSIFLVQIPRLTIGFGFENVGASCGSNEYCPGGWSVLRRPEDYSAHTCNPAVKERSKCPKPYMCVAAKCGISFCCASDKMLEKVRAKESEERDLASAEREEAEERRKMAENDNDEMSKKDNEERGEKMSEL